jgi:Rps23 Pro-64 3,4-dihydroxylase Tpa1-like proline 4-hydroxylase
MIFSYYEVKKLPVVVIDNYYSSMACSKIWQELCFLNNDPKKFKPPGQTGSASEIINGERVNLKDNLALGLDLVYLDRSISSILTENRQLFSQEVVSELEKFHYFFKFVRYANKDSTLVNYYENSHYYRSHMDESTITTLSFFYQNPKSFSGGNLIIEKELTIECLYNRFIIFPSILLHEVEMTSVPPELVGKNFGRYSITQLMSINV